MRTVAYGIFIFFHIVPPLQKIHVEYRCGHSGTYPQERISKNSIFCLAEIVFRMLFFFFLRIATLVFRTYTYILSKVIFLFLKTLKNIIVCNSCLRDVKLLFLTKVRNILT